MPGSKPIAIISLLAMSLLLLAVSGLPWRLGPSYWEFRLRTAPFGDEGLEWVYQQIGEHGGSRSFPFLRERFAEELERGGNDVILSGLLRGIAQTESADATPFLLEVFRRFAKDRGRRYVALHAADALEERRGTEFSPTIDMKSGYRDFGVDEQDPEAEARFEALVEAVASWSTTR